MALLLAFLATICDPIGNHSASHVDPTTSENSEIVVRAPRLSDTGLADTTVIMAKGLDRKIRIELDGDGRFYSYFNGIKSDWGRWQVVDNQLCFKGTFRESFCAPGVYGKKVGDHWLAVGLDGITYKTRLVARH